MRANLFVYREVDDPWLREMRQQPVETMNAALPRLRRITGEYGVAGDVKIRPADLCHAATAIAFQNMDRQFRTDPRRRPTNALRQSFHRHRDRQRCSKPTLVERQAHRAANPVNRLACKQRKRTTVRHGAVRAYDGQVGSVELITSDQTRQRRIGR